MWWIAVLNLVDCIRHSRLLVTRSTSINIFSTEFIENLLYHNILSIYWSIKSYGQLYKILSIFPPLVSACQKIQISGNRDFRWHRCLKYTLMCETNVKNVCNYKWISWLLSSEFQHMDLSPLKWIHKIWLPLWQHCVINQTWQAYRWHENF